MVSLRTLFLSSIAMTIALVTGACNDPAATADTPQSDVESAVPVAVSLEDQVVLPTTDYLKLPQYKKADTGYGLKLAMQCRSCHSFEKNSASPIGPTLYGVFGRTVAAVDSYNYSQALANADFIWTPKALDSWLAEPAAFLPGNRMAFAGLRNQTDRNAVIAALLQLTLPNDAVGDSTRAGRNNEQIERSNKQE